VNSTWLGAWYGAVAWGAYAACEAVFFTLAPLVFGYADVVTFTHWKFTALLCFIYLCAGVLFGSLGGLIVARQPGPPYQQAAMLALVLAYVSHLLAAWHASSEPPSALALIPSAALVLAILAWIRWPLAMRGVRYLTGSWTVSALLIGLSLLAVHQSLILWIGLFVVAPLAAVIDRKVLEPRWSRQALAVAAVVCLVVGGAAVATKELVIPPHRAGPPSATHPNVVLIVMDTVRADHLPVYGYERDTTPRLKNFAREATLYTRAVACSNFTLPSHASIFTGLYPRAHGAILFPPGSSTVLPLDNRYRTVAEVLAEHGYRTLAVVSNTAYVVPEFGVDQGFEVFDARRVAPLTWEGHFLRDGVRGLLNLFASTAGLDEKYRDAAAITTDAISHINSAISSVRPFFMFVNYMDAHAPYIPPAPYDILFRGKDRRMTLSRYYGMQKTVVSQRREITTEERDHLLSQYDGAIAYVDRQLGRLFDFLRQAGVYDSALIVVTSDHGEAFGERNFVEHWQSLFQNEVHVPLLVRYPHQRTGKVETGLVSHVDLMPTILDAVGIKPPEGLHGRSLVHGNANDPRPVFSEVSRGEWLRVLRPHLPPVQYSVHQGNVKLITSSLDGSSCSGETDGLYDLARDPAESHDLCKIEAVRADAMRQVLARWLESTPLQVKRRPGSDLKLLERLRGLGYIR
jgi:arylsulfatase A-like enzyme